MTYSVIVPHYNDPARLARLLCSVPDARDDIEVIVVDDCSPDQPALDAVRARWPRVRWLSTPENGGAGLARNVGLDAACGHWLVFADSDDEFLPGAFETFDRVLRVDDALVYFLAEAVQEVDGSPSVRSERMNELVTDYATAGDAASLQRLQLQHVNPVAKVYARAFIEGIQVRFGPIRRSDDMAAMSLMRHLDISWRAAWFLKHKLMETMFRREQARPLKGMVSVDDAYLGGERAGGKRGRGSENKVPFVAAVELRDGRPHRVRFNRVANFSVPALRHWHKVALTPDSHVISDGLMGFEVLNRDGVGHRVVQPPRGKAGTEIEPYRWLNTVLGNLKTGLSGAHHAFAFRKYGHRYLADAQYRFNRRFRLADMPNRLLVALIQTNPRPAKDLRTPAESWT